MQQMNNVAAWMAVWVLFGLPSIASAVVIDFEGLEPGLAETNEFSGFTIESSQALVIGTSVGYAGNYFVGLGDLEPFSLRQTDGLAFTLSSLELFFCESSDFSCGMVADSVITGFNSLEQVVAQQTVLSPANGGWQSVLLGTDFAAVSRVSISRTAIADFNYVAIDNINVSAVPIPAAVWLLGSALACVAAVRRRHFFGYRAAG